MSDAQVSSPYSHLLGGNGALPEEDHQNVKRHLAQSNARIASLDLEIEELQSRLNILKSKRDIIQQDVDLHKPLVSPVRRLPFDILEQIFYYSLPITRNVTMSTLDGPLKFARVCSSWRSAVYAAPRLWRTLHISIPSFSYRSFDSVTFGSHGFPDRQQTDAERRSEIDIATKRMGGAMEWLKRSNPYPISISIALRTHDNAVPQVLNIIFSTIFSFADRWANIDFDLPFSQPAFHMLSSVTKEKLVHLHTLRLKWSHTPLPPSIAHPQWSKTQLMLAPNLERFQIIGFSGGFKLDVAWSQLTELTIEDCALASDEAREILLKTPKLRRCRLHVSRTPANAQVDDTRLIYLNDLESLALIERGGFAARIRAPKLRRLIHEACRDHAIAPHRRFDVLELTRTDDLPTCLPIHNLEAVTFDPTTTRPDQILNFIQYTPNLRELRLESPKSQITTPERTWMTTYDFKLGNDFLKALTPSISGQGVLDTIGSTTLPPPDSTSLPTDLCPKLVHFECTNCTGFSDRALLDFIYNRLVLSFSNEGRSSDGSTALFSPLRYVDVTFDRVRQIDIREELRVSGFDHLLDSSTPTGMQLCLVYLSRQEGYVNSEIMSPWNGLRSKEMVPDNVDWVVDEQCLYA